MTPHRMGDKTNNPFRLQIRKRDQIVEYAKKNSSTLKGRIAFLDDMLPELREDLLHGNLSHISKSFVQTMQEAEWQRIKHMDTKPGYASTLFKNKLYPYLSTGKTSLDKLENYSDNAIRKEQLPAIANNIEDIWERRGYNAVTNAIRKRYNLKNPKQILSFIVENPSIKIRSIGLEQMSFDMQRRLLGGFLREIPESLVQDMLNADNMRQKLHNSSDPHEISLHKTNFQFIKERDTIDEMFKFDIANKILEARVAYLNEMHPGVREKLLQGQLKSIPYASVHKMREAELERLKCLENRRQCDASLLHSNEPQNFKNADNESAITNETQSESSFSVNDYENNSNFRTKCQALKQQINLKNPENIREYFVGKTSSEDRQIGLRALSRTDRNRLLKGEIHAVPPKVVEEIRALNSKMRTQKKFQSLNGNYIAGEECLGTGLVSEPSLVIQTQNILDLNMTDERAQNLNQSNLVAATDERVTFASTTEPIELSPLLSDQEACSNISSSSLDSFNVPENLNIIKKTMTSHHATTNHEVDHSGNNASSDMVATPRKKKLKSKSLLERNLSAMIKRIESEIIQQEQLTPTESLLRMDCDSASIVSNTTSKFDNSISSTDDEESNEEVIDVTPAVPSVDLTVEEIEKHLSQTLANSFKPVIEGQTEACTSSQSKKKSNKSISSEKIPAATKKIEKQVCNSTSTKKTTKLGMSSEEHNDSGMDNTPKKRKKTEDALLKKVKSILSKSCADSDSIAAPITNRNKPLRYIEDTSILKSPPSVEDSIEKPVYKIKKKKMCTSSSETDRATSGSEKTKVKSTNNKLKRERDKATPYEQTSDSEPTPTTSLSTSNPQPPGDPVLQRMKEIDDRMMQLQQQKMQIDENILRQQQEKMSIEQNVMQLQNERIQLLGNLLSGQTQSNFAGKRCAADCSEDNADRLHPAKKRKTLKKK